MPFFKRRNRINDNNSNSNRKKAIIFIFVIMIAISMIVLYLSGVLKSKEIEDNKQPSPPTSNQPPPAFKAPPPASGSPPPASGSPPPASGSPPPASGSPPPASGSPPPAEPEPCFDGESNISLYDGTTKKIKYLVKGDEILSINGKKSSIKCIIKNKIDREIQLSNINNILITPWHPIRQNNKWVFPNDISAPSSIYIDYIYNIVLNDNHIVYINDIEVVTLGHNFTDPVVGHPYLGTSQVINDLESIDGFNEGLVENIKAVRSIDTGLICKFVKKH